MDPRLERIIDDYFALLWECSPSAATSAGVHDHDERLVDCDPAAVDARLAALRALGRRLASFDDAAALPEDARLDLEVMARDVEVQARVLEETRPPFRDPGYYLDEILYGVYMLAHREFAPLATRMRRAAARLRAVPRLLDQARRNLGDAGAVPRPWVQSAIRQAGGGVAFLLDLERDLVPRAGEGAEALRSGLALGRRSIADFATFLKTLEPRATGDFAIGRSLFEFVARRHHGVEMGVEELRAFGEALVVDTTRRLEDEARAFDPSRTWQDLLEEWKHDHPPLENFLREYEDGVARARAFVQERGIVTIPEGERLVVAATPSFQRSLCPYAAYLPPAPFEPSDGVLWVTPPDSAAPPAVREALLQDHPRPAIPATVVHEAYPGHHLQLSVACRVASRVRRHFLTPVFVEGWGFYCEEMMADEGFYTDPRSRLLQLKDALWRACRVVIDVGLQTGSLGCDAAERMLREVARLEPASARGEILRYTRTPTQPMSYAVGRRAIQDLRDACRGRGGALAEPRAFHDALLAHGSIPLAMVRRRLLGDA